MKIFRGSTTPLGPADPKTFVGSARSKRLATDDTATPVHVYRVEFDAGARTNWHLHSGPQWLFVISGTIRICADGDRAHDLAEGDGVMIAPRERHWHGAAPGSRGVHLAVNIDAVTEWLEPVSDEDYAAAVLH